MFIGLLVVIHFCVEVSQFYMGIYKDIWFYLMNVY